MARVPDELLALMHIGWRAFAARADAVLARRGLGRVHHRVLYLVVRRPGIRVGELARALGVSRQALHPPLAELQRGGYVRAEVPPESGRERAIVATARGQGVERRASGAQRAQLAAVFARQGAAARRGFTEVMAALAAELAPQAPPAAREIVARALALAGPPARATGPSRAARRPSRPSR